MLHRSRAPCDEPWDQWQVPHLSLASRHLASAVHPESHDRAIGCATFPARAPALLNALTTRGQGRTHGGIRMTKWLLAALLCAVSTTAGAQVFTGRIDVSVIDSTGAVLPGVTVSVAGPQNQNAVTDAQGEAHFLNLPAGTYAVKAALQGFSNYLNRAVPVSAGVALPLRVTLGVQGVAEQVQVAAEVPILEPKRQAIATNITTQELQNIPSSRDPWVVLQTVPGVVVDRVNVGGSESG